ncbi:hypothetical protein EG328_002122 [Venturia inaequalis]|uniref:RING-type domain-containing protein n=1 Tax=Venturia inaequalis TaxID=5025 RepID=A0A8H3UX62_VENIN|nr:hypothetical protein EG328_002122 [Venturia inaequalis]
MANSAKIGKNACGICNLPTGHANSSGTLEDLVKLPCTHIFGDKCISAWLKAQEYGHCPTCHVDCAKDFVDTWRLLKETASVGESLGAGVKEEGGDEHVEATSFGGLETAKLDVKKNEIDDENEDDPIDEINEAAIIEGLIEVGEPDIEQPVSGDETKETTGSIDARIEASAVEIIRAEPPAIDNQIEEETIDSINETAGIKGRIEDPEIENLDAEQNDIGIKTEDTAPIAGDVENNIGNNEETAQAVVQHTIEDHEDASNLEDAGTTTVEKIVETIEHPRDDTEATLINETVEMVNEEAPLAQEPSTDEPESVEDNSAEDQANDDAEVEGLEIIAEVSAEDEASGNEVEELEGTDNVEFADEIEESIEGAEGAVQDIIDEGFIDEDITLVADIGVANDFKNGAVAEAVLADEGLTKEALGEEAVEELAVDTEANDESTAQEEVAGENPADETAGENGGGPTWGTAQENPELQAARSLHFFRTHGYGDQYRTELEASRNAAGRSTRNMVSAFNVKAHPLPEGGERALVSKNIQVWAKYLHALKLKSLDELKTTRSRKFRVDIAGWYAKQREDFFEQLDKNLESQNQDGPDVEAVEVAENLLKTGDAEKIKELESILASLE